MRHIYTSKAPTPGFYSQAVEVDPLTHTFLFISGQTGNDVNLKDEAVVDGGVGLQTTQSLKNLLLPMLLNREVVARNPTMDLYPLQQLLKVVLIPCIALFAQPI